VVTDRATADDARMVVGLNALRVLAQVNAAEQIVGRERNQRACHRQLVRNVVTSRRVNSIVRAHRYFRNDRLKRRPFLVNQKPEARYNQSALEQVIGPERESAAFSSRTCAYRGCVHARSIPPFGVLH
jgi:hypothetical protein